MTGVLVEAAWITARISAALALFVASIGVVWTWLGARGRPVGWRAPGSEWRVLAMAASLIAAAALITATRGEAERVLPPAVQGAAALLSSAASLAAGAMLFWSARALGKNLAAHALARDGGSLVTTGPFAVVRHPLYVSVAVLLLAIGLAVGSLSGTFVGTGLVAAAIVWRARLEDALLARTYPGAYEEYAARVPAFLPRL